MLAVDQFAVLGGGQRLLLDVVGDQVSHGAVVILALPAEGPVADSARAKGATTVSFSLPALPSGSKPVVAMLRYLAGSWSAARQLTRVARAGRVGVFYVNGPRCLLPSVVAARRCGLPVVAAIHLVHHRWIERRVLLLCLRSSTVVAVTFCSQVALEPFKDSLDLKAKVLWNWVSDEFFARPSERASARRELGFGEGDVVVGVLGRLSPNKGQAELIRGLRGPLRERQGLRLVVAGGTDFEDPRFSADLRRLARDADLERQILFLGPVSDSVRFLDALDILVVPSQWEEPFGLVAAEGMARSLPVVATMSGGLVEVVEDGVTGVLTSKDPYSLAHAVMMLVDDRVARRRMGAKGRLRAERLFRSQDRLAALRTLLKSRPPRRSATHPRKALVRLRSGRR